MRVLTAGEIGELDEPVTGVILTGTQEEVRAAAQLLYQNVGVFPVVGERNAELEMQRAREEFDEKFRLVETSQCEDARSGAGIRIPPEIIEVCPRPWRAQPMEGGWSGRWTVLDGSGSTVASWCCQIVAEMLVSISRGEP